MAKSRNEAALENILGAENELLSPVSRNEKWLHKILGEEIETDPIQSRIEQLLHDIAEQGIGGEQPQLFAPVVTGGINEISWANNPNNGAFEVTFTADVDGTPVTSPLTITEEMDGSTLTITANAENFKSNSTIIPISYIAETPMLYVSSVPNASIVIRGGNNSLCFSDGENDVGDSGIALCAKYVNSSIIQGEYYLHNKVAQKIDLEHGTNASATDKFVIVPTFINNAIKGNSSVTLKNISTGTEYYGYLSASSSYVYMNNNTAIPEGIYKVIINQS